MGVGIGGMTGQDATRPAVGAADLDELMREDAGITAGEGVRLGDGRMSAGDRPCFELRREVRAIEQGDGEPRRVSPPLRRIEAGGAIFPRPHRRTPFPDPQLTLACPAHAPEKPGRAEVMEQREEH